MNLAQILGIKDAGVLVQRGFELAQRGVEALERIAEALEYQNNPPRLLG